MIFLSFPIALVFVFILGMIVGSFLNVVILRIRTGRSLYGRSACPSCGKILRWWELIPVFGFFLLLGRCSSCKSKISWQYPIVESLTGLLFLLSFVKIFSQNHSFPEAVLHVLVLFMFVSVLVVISIYDLRHKIIPDSTISVLIFLGLFRQALLFLEGREASPLDWLSPVIFFLFFFAFWFLSQGRAMGLGDAKLAFAVALFMGFFKTLSGIVLAFWIGAGVSLVLLLAQKLIVNSALFGKQKIITIRSEIPFAPFIIFGSLVAFFLDIDIFHALI